MSGTTPVPLVLGGHSFIRQLGNDPAPTGEEAAAIVAACLDHGITWFDTTYAPERVALGQALARLGRRDEATILAWNFFTDFGPEGEVGGPEPYRPEHLDRMRRELQTDRIDILIVHPVPDPDDQRWQEERAVSWRERGSVGRLGTWMPGADVPSGPYELAVAPCNVTTADAVERFAGYRARGWETLATSPFVRGWELDRLAERGHWSKEVLADRMLRYAAFTPDVDRLVVAIRRVDWVERNVRSWRRGPLTGGERAALLALARRDP
jgi:aryl-alcohol dehydrogenase-like predicted oxidoreductase